MIQAADATVFVREYQVTEKVRFTEDQPFTLILEEDAERILQKVWRYPSNDVYWNVK